MAFIDDQLVEFKEKIENAIVTGGARGKESMIRSSQLINLIHDAVKYELIQNGVIKLRIYKTFVEKMIVAWDYDVKEEIISKKGVFLHNPEESAILALEWGGYTPNAEKNLFDKINETIKNRVLNNSVNDFSRVRLIQKKQTNNHQKTL